MALKSFQNEVTYSNAVTSMGVSYFAGGAAKLYFNDPSRALTGTYVVLSAAATPHRAIVDIAYNGIEFAIVQDDRSSSTFTCLTAAGSVSALAVTNNNHDSTGPDIRRLKTMGMI